MSLMLSATFQVIVAAAFSFWGAVVIALLGCWALRLRDGRVRLAVMLLPFAKLVRELVRGVPANGFFWQKAHGAIQELGGFRVGFGVDRISPVVDIELSALSRGQHHPQSAADLCVTALTRYVAAPAPAVIGGAFVVLSVLGLVRLAIRIIQRERADWRTGAIAIDERSLGWRRVTIVTSTSWLGVPFASGLRHGVVCLPAHVSEALSSDEREAVVQHELAHLRGFHVIVLSALEMLERALWFLPGTRWLAREARAQIEISADDAAIRAGVAPGTLAAALVKVAELVRPAHVSPALALFDPPSVLARRVGRLLRSRPAKRWLALALRGLGIALLAATILRATTLGNP